MDSVRYRSTSSGKRRDSLYLDTIPPYVYVYCIQMQEEIVCVGWDGCMDQDDETEPPAPQTDPHVPNNDINGDTNNATNTAFAGAATQEQSVMTSSTLQNRVSRRAGY